MVLVWELFNYGATPYGEDHTPEQIIIGVFQGLRLPTHQNWKPAVIAYGRCNGCSRPSYRMPQFDASSMGEGSQ
jgi:hypothetical protein